MKVSDKGIVLIKSFERKVLEPYLCPAGYATIGYGHLIKSHENFTVITEDQAERILYQDLYISESAILRLTYVALSQNQFDALVSFVFNVGAASYQRSTLRCKLNRVEDLEIVAGEFGRWVYIRGKKSFGLVKRRLVESMLFQER